MIGKMLGHYRIESKLGEAGMRVVYKASDTHLDRPVAIRVLAAAAVANPDRVAGASESTLIIQHTDDLKVALRELKEEPDSGKLSPRLRSRGALPPARGFAVVLGWTAVVLLVAFMGGWWMMHSRAPRPGIEWVQIRGDEGPALRQAYLSGPIGDRLNCRRFYFWK
jgi:hypothetical protein